MNVEVNTTITLSQTDVEAFEKVHSIMTEICGRFDEIYGQERCTEDCPWTAFCGEEVSFVAMGQYFNANVKIAPLTYGGFKIKNEDA